jgi:lipoprotein-anchoring transpeptidase ErfK/SrfK
VRTPTGVRGYPLHAMRRPLTAALLALAALPTTAGAQTRQAEPVIPPGATAAGVAVGGLTLSAAAARLDETFSAVVQRPVEVRVGGRRVKAGMKAIGFEFDPLRTAKRANVAALATPPAADGTHPVDVPLATSWSPKKLAAFAKRASRRTRVKPRNAKLRMTVRRMIVRRARMGWKVKPAAVRKAIVPILRDPRAVRVVRPARKRVHPKINSVDVRRRNRTVVTIDRDGFRLRLFKNLKRSKSYRIAVGAPGYATPTGTYSIANKAVNPAWSAPDQPWAGAYRNEVVEGGAADNPLKARWLGVIGGVGIHGTAAEYSIGTRASHGCIRMRVADVIDLYSRVPVGTPVLIR